MTTSCRKHCSLPCNSQANHPLRQRLRDGPGGCGDGRVPVEDLLELLPKRFPVVPGGSRSGPGPQKTLSASIDWSYRLLANDEAMLFRRLAVFKGGFNVESARAVCADGIGGSMLDVLTGLVQKSMVVAERLDDGSTRFRLLESHRVYALYHLLQAGGPALSSKLPY